MVSNYNNTQCGYRIDKLDKVVYLISEEATKNIHIDNGEAYVDEIAEEPIALSVYNISLSDTDELDERYRFTHTLTFSVDGYVNYTDFQGRYYAIVKTLDGEYWLVNPLFPCKVTYTYTLGANESHTDFTLATASNHPTLRIVGMDEATPYECGYKHCGFKSLKLNDKMYSMKKGNHVVYTNDGFKDIFYNRYSASFVEIFDGVNVQHQLKFDIKFDDYKSSWHYNLLEFIHNKYSAIIDTTCGKYILCGFGFGLQPSFTVEAANTDSDKIHIELVDMHDNGNFLAYESGITIEADASRQYVYTTKYNGYECVGTNTARYLLKEEVDAFNNPTGNYICLYGYESEFSYLSIVGTFDETDEFVNPECSGIDCRLQTSFPNKFVFNISGSCRSYSLLSDSDWTITSSANHITVSPTSGEANASYTIQVCNSLAPSSTPVESTISVSYCSGLTKNYDVKVVSGNSCFTAGATFDISANGQYVTIPTQCCVRSVTESTSAITNIAIQNTYIRVYIPQNNTNAARTFIFNVTFCDNTTSEVTINQGIGFERWVKEGTTCSNGKKCDVERKYTGTTALNINTRTNETRNTNCVDSDECSSTKVRWIDSSETTCSNGKKYIVQVEQRSSDGSTWVNTGNKRLGAETQDSPAECSGTTTYEKWEETSGYTCDETTKYNKLQLYTSTDNTNWIATDVYKKGTTVLGVNSSDCGYIVPSTAWTCDKWEAEDTICDDGSKYEKQQRYVRNCTDCNNCNEQWIATGVWRKGSVLEANSTECGFDPSTSGWCSEYRDDGTTICDGYDKKKYLLRYVRNCEDCSNCSSAWTATAIRKIGDIVKVNSFDCGYIPTTNYFAWNLIGTECNGYDKYNKYVKYISENGTDWYLTNIHKLGDAPIEVNSVDCGYNGGIQYEYRWILTDETICGGEEEPQIYYRWVNLDPSVDYYCSGTTKYYKQQKQQSTDNVNWENVIPAEYRQGESAQTESTDCGYVPPVANYKLYATYNDSTDYTVECNSSTTLTSRETTGHSTSYSSMTSAHIGDCVTSIDNNAFRECTNMTSVSISNSVTSIGYFAFYNCSGLTSINIPSGVTSIERNTFVNCVSLSSCTLGNGLATIENKAFENCYSLLSINIPNSVTIIGEFAFLNCSGLTSCTIGSGATSIGSRAFWGCSSLATANIQGGSIGESAFTYCYDLTSVTLGSGVTYIADSAFRGCSGLTSINIPSGITSIDNYTFSHCSSITSITIPNSVTNIGEYAFSNCRGLTSIEIPSGVTSIGRAAFMICDNLTSITVRATTPPNVGGSFTFYETNDCTIYVPAASVNAYKTASGWSDLASRIQAIPNS